MIDANKPMTLDLHNADICIMGGGIAGITLARKLKNSRYKILLVESGDENYQQNVQNLYSADKKPELFPDPLSSRLRMLGGSSNHWENSTERLDPIDLTKRDWIPDSGWPIKYEELVKYYSEAELYCGLDDEGYDLKYWADEFNFEDKLNNSGTVNNAIVKSSFPFTRFFVKYGDELRKADNINIIVNANVLDIDIDSGIIKSITISNLNGQHYNVKAKVFVMCFGGIENARMLLHFNTTNNNQLGNQYDNVGRYFMEHPTIRAANFFPFEGELHRIYNGIQYNGQLIKARFKLTEGAQIQHKMNNLRLFLTKSSNIRLSEGVSSAHVVKDSLKNSELPDNFGNHLINIVKDIDIISELYLRKEFDTSLFDSVDEYGGYQFISMIEQSPNRNNRITLGDDVDQLKIRKINIEWTIQDNDKAMAWKSLEILAKDPVINEIGRIRILKENESRIWGNQLGFGHHHIGTTRMSDDITKGVVNSTLKVYGTNNLYISGSSVFPTGGHVPPTLTIVALTLRLADKIKETI
jgi:choline dehydrogenase-like flavoprotein